MEWNPMARVRVRGNKNHLFTEAFFKQCHPSTFFKSNMKTLLVREYMLYKVIYDKFSLK